MKFEESDKDFALSCEFNDFRNDLAFENKCSVIIKDEDKLDLEENSNEGQYDVFLSMLLGILLVKFKDLKQKLVNIQDEDHPENIRLKKEIFDSIDILTMVNEIKDLSKGETLLEIPSSDFYEFWPFIATHNSEDSFDISNEESILIFIATLFPMLSSKSQIDLLCSNLAEKLNLMEPTNYKTFLKLIDSPYFMLDLIKVKLAENIGTKVNKKYSADPLFELLYLFEDFILGDFRRIHMNGSHV